MSTQEEEDVESPTYEQSIASLQMTRRLHTFGAPDLEVIIGKSEKLYRYHSFLLASQSEYVDTILSSPVALKNQEAGRINFPDIDIETWEKMIKFLSPGVPHPTLEEMIIVIPFYDKYQFTVGLKYCDDLLSARIHNNNWRTDREFCCLISMIWPLNGFPLSKPIAVNWASRMLRMFHTIDEGMFPVLMPLVENDEAVVKSMVSTYLGRMCKGMSMNEMRDLIKQPDFPEKCITRCKQINALDDQIQRLSVEKVYIHGGCGDGTYVYCSSSEFIKEYNSEFATCHNGGAMKGYWIEETKYPDEILVLGSMDVFGNTWEVFSRPRSVADDEHNHTMIMENKRVLWRWDNGIFNSLVPPTDGWKIVDETVDQQRRMQISFSFSNKRSY